MSFVVAVLLLLYKQVSGKGPLGKTDAREDRDFCLVSTSKMTFQQPVSLALPDEPDAKHSGADINAL